MLAEHTAKNGDYAAREVSMWGIRACEILKIDRDSGVARIVKRESKPSRLTLISMRGHYDLPSIIGKELLSYEYVIDENGKKQELKDIDVDYDAEDFVELEPFSRKIAW